MQQNTRESTKLGSNGVQPHLTHLACITVGGTATRCQKHNFATNPLMTVIGDWELLPYSGKGDTVAQKWNAEQMLSFHWGARARQSFCDC